MRYALEDGQGRVQGYLTLAPRPNKPSSHSRGRYQSITKRVTPSYSSVWIEIQMINRFGGILVDLPGGLRL